MIACAEQKWGVFKFLQSFEKKHLIFSKLSSCQAPCPAVIWPLAHYDPRTRAKNLKVMDRKRDPYGQNIDTDKVQVGETDPDLIAKYRREKYKQ